MLYRLLSATTFISITTILIGFNLANQHDDFKMGITESDGHGQKGVFDDEPFTKIRVEKRSMPERVPPDGDAILLSFSFIKQAAKRPGWAAYIGCFSTSDQWSVETAHLTSARLRNAGSWVRLCVEDCWEQRARFALIGRGGNCMCGKFLEMAKKDDNPSLCRSPCVNNNTYACGGTTALDMYYTGYIEEPKYNVFNYGDIRKVYKGCYEDPKYTALCPFSFSTTRMNVQMCMEYCSENFFKYATLDSPQKCCCTSDLGKSFKTKTGHCNLLCETGRGKHESCGGDKGFLAVYVTGAVEIPNAEVVVPRFVWMQPNLNDSDIRKLSDEKSKTGPGSKSKTESGEQKVKV